MIRSMKALGGLLLAGALAACGGGGGSAGTNPQQPGTGGTGGTGNTSSSLVADFVMYTDKTTISNTGADSAKLTVVAVDANRNVVSGATVTTTVDQNAVFVPASTTTDATGSYTGMVQIGGDKTDRDITVTVTVNGITKRTSVRVSGSKLTLAPSNTSPAPNTLMSVSATLVDASANPIQGVTVSFGGNTAAANQTAVTNASGVATVSFTSPSNAGVYTISASGGGTTATEYQLQVFSTAGAVPTATIPAGVNPSLSATPNVLSVNTSGSTANKSVIRFLILDGNGNPIPNVRVQFRDLTTGLAAQGASLSNTGQLYTDVSGAVSVEYYPGPNSSPTNGVLIRACYSGSDFTSTDCPASVDATLTVAGQALSVSIGDDNLLQASSGTYIKRFAVTVADSAGRAVPNAPVDISVDLTHYSKGAFAAPWMGSSDPQGLSVVPLSPTGAYPSMTDAASTTQRVWCPNEDVNRNGNVDPTTVFGGTSENYNGSTDSNGQPTLEPRKSDLLISYDDPTVTTTDANGLLIIKVQYSQRFATWLAYRIRVTANVSGSQGMAERLFVTNYLEADKESGSFWTPPYGVNSCLTAN